MRKFLPLVVSGIAAISFSALAADPSSTGPNAQGRSVDTGGGRPDSSKAEGTEPVTSPTPGTRSDSSATTGSDTSATTGSDMKSKRSERKAKRDANATSGSSTGAAATGSATAADPAPTSPSGGSAPATSTPGTLGSPNSGGSK